MKIVEKYTGEKTYMFPNGALATKEEVLKQFPAALAFVHYVETDENGEVMWAFQNLSAMRTVQIQEIINTEPEIDTTPTAEERIASALEFQNLQSMADVDTTASE